MGSEACAAHTLFHPQVLQLGSGPIGHKRSSSVALADAFCCVRCAFLGTAVFAGVCVCAGTEGIDPEKHGQIL